MSVSLVIIRLETVEESVSLKHLEYQAKSKVEKCGPDRESSPSEWPLLVTERLLSIHRGLREPSKISVTTLDDSLIMQEMAAINKEEDDISDQIPCDNVNNLGAAAEKKSDTNVGSGGVPRRSSKESTPGASSSKEGTPGPSDEGGGGGRRVIRGHKDRVPFISGNPMVDVTKGILHIYMENTKTSMEDSVERSEMLCMLGVPTSLTTHDLLQFTAPCNPEIQHMRIIRDSTPNQYMVLIKFRSQNDADIFYNNFNGQKYNSMEDNMCKLVYVATVQTTKESEDGGLPILGHTELPTCPVCLERMDESVDGILTVLCNHSFHGECLAKWGDTSCPVCRFCQTPEETPDQRCLLCGSTESLWICLICGNVGCGRYVGGHAHRHFLETNHLFSLQVGNNRVWDYVRDNYVHRLLQSEGDGKVVSYEPNSPIADTKVELVHGEEKLTALQLEYTHLLSSQLESQRLYFESRIGEAQSEAIREADDCRKIAQQRGEELGKMKTELQTAVKDKQSHERKILQLSTKLTKTNKELETEQHLNMSLRENKIEWVSKIVHLEKTVHEKNMEITELDSQVKDIMVHMEALSTIKDNPELQGGNIAVSPTYQGQHQGVRRKKK